MEIMAKSLTASNGRLLKVAALVAAPLVIQAIV